MQQNSDEEKSRKVWTSFGIARGYLPFLYPKEQLDLQELNLFTYNISISRVQIVLKLPELIYFTGCDTQGSLYTFDKTYYKTTKICDTIFRNLQTIQVKDGLYGLLDSANYPQWSYISGLRYSRYPTELVDLES